MRIGILGSRVRGDEKLLIEAAVALGHQPVWLDSGHLPVRLADRSLDLGVEIVLNRCLSSTQALYLTTLLEGRGVRVLNNAAIVRACEDKLLTSLLLQVGGVPTPRVAVAFTPDSALVAIEKMGYPVVIKPTTGSWGRLMAKIESRLSAEAVLEHKAVLGTYHHSIFYIQKYVNKPGRDIRAFVLDGKVIAAIYRASEHWITNTARGGKASNCPVTPELQELCARASGVIGGGILAMDVFETDGGLSINEINHAMEFKNSEAPTGVSISQAVIQYCVEAGTH